VWWCIAKKAGCDLGCEQPKKKRQTKTLGCRREGEETLEMRRSDFNGSFFGDLYRTYSGKRHREKKQIKNEILQLRLAGPAINVQVLVGLGNYTLAIAMGFR
jgi:hypothetical protein